MIFFFSLSLFPNLNNTVTIKTDTREIAIARQKRILIVYSDHALSKSSLPVEIESCQNILQNQSQTNVNRHESLPLSKDLSYAEIQSIIQSGLRKAKQGFTKGISSSYVEKRVRSRKSAKQNLRTSGFQKTSLRRAKQRRIKQLKMILNQHVDKSKLGRMLERVTKQICEIDEEEYNMNDSFCSRCGCPGELLCCDGCTRSFHPGCVSLLAGMRDEWYCPFCQREKKQERRKGQQWRYSSENKVCEDVSLSSQKLTNSAQCTHATQTKGVSLDVECSGDTTSESTDQIDSLETPRELSIHEERSIMLG